jgi:guanylate kinase
LACFSIIIIVSIYLPEEMYMPNREIDFHLLHPQPLMIVLSGPSGVGKDTVIKQLQKRNLPLHFVVTVNSRQPRPEERDGVDYFFITRERFEQMIAHQELLEYARVYQDYKGVPKEQVRKALATGKDVILRLDVQGAKRIKTLNPDAILIFLIPTTEKEWLERLRKRKADTLADRKVRIEKVKEELESLPIFDYVVLNADGRLREAVDMVEAIIRVEHLRIHPRKINI